MPKWGLPYYLDLIDKCESIANDLPRRLDDIVAGRVAPAVEDIPIGSARKMPAAVLFFDIRNFSGWSHDPRDAGLRRALLMLDIVIPMMMYVLHDYDAYVEKNTGDGLMALFPAATDAEDAVDRALTASTVMFYVLQHVVNPKLVELGLPGVDARIGIDAGPILISRIGVASGSAKIGRNGLVAVGPAAVIACRLQELAGTNEIWIGHSMFQAATDRRRGFCVAATPADWGYVCVDQPAVPYWVWRYAAEMKNPSTVS